MTKEIQKVVGEIRFGFPCSSVANAVAERPLVPLELATCSYGAGVQLNNNLARVALARD